MNCQEFSGHGVRGYFIEQSEHLSTSNCLYSLEGKITTNPSAHTLPTFFLAIMLQFIAFFFNHTIIYLLS